MRVRNVGPQEVGVEPRQFEQIIRDKLGQDPNRVSEFPAEWIRGGGPRPYWEGLPGLHMESVELEGCCPHTSLVFLFRLVDRPDLLFGTRNRIWPAESADPGLCAGQFEIYLMEDVGRALKRAARDRHRCRARRAHLGLVGAVSDHPDQHHRAGRSH
jgi:hypothetical protein